MDAKETAGARVYVVQPADVDAAGTCAADRWWISVAARAFPALATTSKAKRERKAQRLFLNGNAGAATNTPVAVGDRIAYAPPRAPRADAAEEGRDGADRSPQQWLLVCQRQGMRLVYDNDAFAVIAKPVGIHVKGRGLRTVEYALPALLQGRPAGVNKMARDALPTPHAMHRLDYRVGGLLLVAKTRSAEVALAGQFERHYVVKRYRAILVGRLEPSKLPGLVLSPPPEWNNDKQWTLGESATSTSDQGAVHFYDAPLQGKRSCTALVVRSVTPSARYGWLTTVDLWPLTGRWHQLRLHMASLGHPIVGDDLHHNHHGDPFKDDLTLPDVVRGAGLFLHAVGLCFDDPQGNRRSFEIAEPHKFGRFRHFCALNRGKQINRERRTSDVKP